MLFTQILRYHFKVFIEISIIQQTTTCVIIFLTCCKFLNVIIWSLITLNGLIKNVFLISLDILIFYFYFLKIISCASFVQIFVPWKLESIKKSKYWLSIENFDWYLYQLRGGYSPSDWVRQVSYLISDTWRKRSSFKSSDLQILWKFIEHCRRLACNWKH